MHIATLGIDIGKTAYHLIGLDDRGAIIHRSRLSRMQLLRFTGNLPSCLIGMEASGSAHDLARQLREQGHQPRIMPAQYVRPFVKTNKNDHRDAEAIAEAVQRPSMRFVPLKEVDQQDLQLVHRHRARLMRRRTALLNQIRGVLRERGITAALGVRALVRVLANALADGEPRLSPRLCALLIDMREEWQWLDGRIQRLDQELNRICRDNEPMRRLISVPGIGPLTATALVAAISDGSAFKRGRDLAAWLGLVPKQWSTGGRTRLLGISKRGNSYLRTLFVHGARALRRVLDRDRPGLGRWVGELERRAHVNVVIVALANKLARMAWAVLRHRLAYEPAMPAR